MNLENFDRSFERHQRQMERGFKAFWVVWCVAAVLGLGLTAVGIWAIIRLVTHFAP